MRSLLLAFLFLTGTLAVADDFEEPLTFSTTILPYEELSSFAWGQFSLQVPFMFNKRPYRLDPDGSVRFAARNGDPHSRLVIHQQLNTERTARRVEFGFESDARHSAGFVIFRLVITTYGQNLEELAVERLQKGVLPFYPSKANEDAMRLHLWVFNTEVYEIELAKRNVDGARTVTGVFRGQEGRDSALVRILTYQERVGPGFRSFSYDEVSPSLGGKRVKLTATRVRQPEQVMGSEFFALDGKPVKKAKFEVESQKLFNNWVVSGWLPLGTILTQLISADEFVFSTRR